VLGLILVPVQLAWVGNDAFGLISLVTTSIGFAALFQDLMRFSMIRELGAAYHDDDPARFRHVYSSSFVISAAVAALTFLAFAGLLYLMRFLTIPDTLRPAANWMVIAEGTYVCLLVFLSPAINMYVVMERFVVHNIFSIATRSSFLVATLVLFLGFHVREPGPALTSFGILSAAIRIAVLLLFVFPLLVGNPKFRPGLRLVSRSAIKSTLGTFGWNSGVILAMNLHERLPAFIMNIFFGLAGNAIWGVGFRLAAYLRMLTMGMTFGLDAVATRFASEKNNALPDLLRHLTRLHAFAALPGALGVLLLANPVVQIWVGHRPDVNVTASAIVAQILVFAMTSRAISDGWIRILYGAGFVHRYAPLVMVGGVANPTLAIVLVALAPPHLRLYAPAAAFSIVLLLFHLLILPTIGARCLDIRYRDLLTPIVRPAIVTAVCSPILILAAAMIQSWTFTWLVIVCGTFSACYLALSIAFVLTSHERRRFFAAAKRALPARG
jgi:hypothetical protein